MMKKFSLPVVILIVTGMALSVGCSKKKPPQPTREVPVVQDMNIQTDSDGSMPTDGSEASN